MIHVLFQQFFFSVYLSQMSSEEDPPTYEQQHRAWKNSVMMKQEFQIQFNANCSKQEWLFEVRIKILIFTNMKETPFSSLPT